MNGEFVPVVDDPPAGGARLNPAAEGWLDPDPKVNMDVGGWLAGAGAVKAGALLVDAEAPPNSGAGVCEG